MSRIFFIYLLGSVSLVTFWACNPELEFTLPEEAPKMVVWAYLNPDSIIGVHLSESQSLGDIGDPKLVDDALVLLFEHNQLSDTLLSQGDGWYLSSRSLRPLAGSVYHVEVRHEAYPTLETIADTIPLPPVVQTATTSIEELQDNGNNTNVLAGIRVILQEDPENGYVGHRVVFLSTNPPERASFWVPDGFACDNLGLFFNYGLSAFNLSCHSDIRTYQIISTNFDREELAAAEVSVCFFSPKTIKMQEQLGRFHDLNTGSYSVDPFYEPISLPEFTKNGYGFVGGYSCTHIQVDF